MYQLLDIKWMFPNQMHNTKWINYLMKWKTAKNRSWKLQWRDQLNQRHCSPIHLVYLMIITGIYVFVATLQHIHTQTHNQSIHWKSRKISNSKYNAQRSRNISTSNQNSAEFHFFIERCSCYCYAPNAYASQWSISQHHGFFLSITSTCIHSFSILWINTIYICVFAS